MELIEFGTIMNMVKGKKPLNQSPKKKEGFKPYVDIKAFETDKVDNYTDGEKCLACAEGDILIVCDGSRSGLVGKAIDGYVGSTLAKISAEGLNGDYLFYFLQGKYTLLNTKKKGTGTPHLNPDLLRKQKIYVPSIEEQDRIVSRIEELFSELDKGVETLKIIKEQLAVYRQAVLKDAFEGKLTGSRSKGEVVLGDYIETPRYGTSKKCTYDRNADDVPVFRIPNIDYVTGCLDKEDLKYATFNEKELFGLQLKREDILIIRSNGSVSLVGRASMVSERDVNGTFAGYLMRLRIKQDKELLPKYLLLFLQSHQARIYIESKAKSTSGVNNINSSEISGLTLPMYSKEDQLKITKEIESRLSVYESIEQTVDTALLQAEVMRQSILKRAFEGGLN